MASFNLEEITYFMSEDKVRTSVKSYLKSLCFDYSFQNAILYFQNKKIFSPFEYAKKNDFNYSEFEFILNTEIHTHYFESYDSVFVNVPLFSQSNNLFGNILFQSTSKKEKDIDLSEFETLSRNPFLYGFLSRFLKLDKNIHIEELIENSLTMMCILDTNGKFNYINNSFLNNTGWNQFEFNNKNFIDFIHPDDVLLTLDEFSKLNSGIACVNFETKFLCSDNKHKIFRWSANPNLKTKEIFCTATDITKDKNTEHKLQSIVKEMLQLKEAIDHSAIVAITDIRGNITYANDKFCQISKFSKEELIGSNQNIVNSGFHSKDFFREMWKTIAKGDIWKGEIKNKAKDGSFYWVDTTIIPFYDEERKPYEFIAIRYDITHQKHINEELLLAKIGVEQLMKAKDSFLSNMSHEIRTPMNAIIGFSDILSQTPLNEEQADYVKTISIASNNLLVIINDILDYSKIESGKIEIENIPISISDIIQNVVKLSESKAKDKGIKLIKMIDTDLPNWVLGDSVRITQILINIISNAIKFTHKGKVELSAIVEEIEYNNCVVCFSVKDTGIGIPQDKISKIFERFEQVSSSTTREFGGTGLGLSIVKMLTELFNGTIEVNSAINIGTEFKITIPFQISSQKEVISSNLASNSSQNIRIISGKKCLLVEDNSLNQKLATKLLHKYNIDIDYAQNGQEAVEKAICKNYDFIMMDIQMPIMDGYQASKVLRSEHHLTTPIIACTAHSMVAEKQKCLDLGMNNYISKPYTEIELLRVIASVIDKKSIYAEPSPVIINEIISTNYEQKILELEDKYGKDFTLDILNIFTSEIPDEILEIQDAFETKNFERIVFLSHKFKGYLAVLSLDYERKIADIIEQAGKSRDFKSISENFQPLLDAFAGIFNAIRNY